MTLTRSGTIRTFDTWIVFSDTIRGHRQDHAVVIGVGPKGLSDDPSVQLIAWDDEGKKLWSIAVQVARLCVGPTTLSAEYSPTVLLIQLQDNTTGRRPDHRLSRFPIERILEIIKVDEDDINLKSQYTHLFHCSREMLHIFWGSVVDFLFKLGTEVGSATGRIKGKEFFAEGGSWTDDMSNPITRFPTPAT